MAKPSGLPYPYVSIWSQSRPVVRQSRAHGRAARYHPKAKSDDIRWRCAPEATGQRVRAKTGVGPSLYSLRVCACASQRRARCWGVECNSTPLTSALPVSGAGAHCGAAARHTSSSYLIVTPHRHTSSSYLTVTPHRHTSSSYLTVTIHRGRACRRRHRHPRRPPSLRAPAAYASPSPRRPPSSAPPPGSSCRPPPSPAASPRRL